LPQRLLHLLALGNVTNVALNDSGLGAQSIDVADKLHGNGAAVFGFKGEIFIADVLFILQFGERELAFLDVFEWPNFPECRSQQFFERVTQQINQEGIGVCYRSRLRVEDQDSIFGGLEEAAIS